MPTAYEQSYGEVTFYTLTGTKIYAMVADLGMWLAEDTEPSPEPKWVRVDVPGADGAVDLSRALAGQVTYEPRKVALRFAGKKADHATALTTIRNLRKALHGARVKVETMLTKLSSGYYIADCECDGEAHTDGAIEVTVTCVCDPFIRTGTQTLALAGTSPTTKARSCSIDLTDGMVTGTGSLTPSYYYQSASGYRHTPMGATSGRLWYVCGPDAASANVLDITQTRVLGAENDIFTYDSTVKATGHVISMGTLTTSTTKSAVLSAFRRTGYISDSGTVGFPFMCGNGSSYGQSMCVAVYLTGTITSVSSPEIELCITKNTIRVGDSGLPLSTESQTYTFTQDVPIVAGTYDGTLVAHEYFTLNYPADFLYIQLSGIASTDLLMQLAVTKTDAGMSQTWVEPRIGYVDVDFGGTFCRSTTNGDSATISPVGVTTTHNCAMSASGYTAADLNDPYTTSGSVGAWLPTDAKRACMSVVNSYGEECPLAPMSAKSYAIGTKTGTNTTMRSVPTITSTGGAYVEIDGRTSIVGAGTVELQGLTIPGGAFSVDYATLDGADATLTWEGGVL